MRRLLAVLPLLVGGALLLPVETTGQEKKKKKADPPAAKADAKPQAATPPDTLRVAKGFKVELLYSVPKEQQGSWVNLCTDPKGRLIVSDQYGPLYRVTPPPVGATGETKIEKIPADIGGAQGLCWAFDALYVVVNAKTPNAGLFKVTDSDGDDMPDKVELLREFEGGGGEHGPHAVIPHPDGKRLTVVCGNQTALTKFDTTRVPPIWGEDHLLPRLPDGNGFMKGKLGPGGAIYNVTPDGKAWELFSVGFRNQYDAAYNAAGDLFTYDADMEWDMNTPWYRPTRICLVTSGSEFGWRNGAGKYPAYYPDNLPGVCDIGPGSPTGVCFGYGAKFPKKYQDAFYALDWSYGKLYAVHLSPKGSGYVGQAEEFITGTPLPLTDAIVNPKDGAMYVTIGGRKTQSGLYRVTYTGPVIDEPPPVADPLAENQRKRRLAVETLHTPEPSKGPNARQPRHVFASTGDDDRFIRFASRVALEHAGASAIRSALEKAQPADVPTLLLALVRVSAPDPFHRKPTDPEPSPGLRASVLDRLAKLDIAGMTDQQKLDVLRVYHVLFNRFGPPTNSEREAIFARFEGMFPTPNRWVNAELGQLLVYLEASSIGRKMVAHMLAAPTQEEQMEYMRSLRCLKTGWTPELREQYFGMFVKAAGFRGGNSLRGFMKLMRDDALANVPAAEKPAIQKIIDSIPTGNAVVDSAPKRPFVKKWTIAELAPKLEAALKGGRDFDRGRKLFAETRCFGCHRFDSDGSSYGPDLSGVAGRFGPKDLLESVLDPSKEVSDQYAAVKIETEDGKTVVGRIVNLNGDNLMVNTDMLDPNAMATVKRADVASMVPSKLSMMPEGLLDVLKEDEVLDLLAYLLSRGDRAGPMFKK